MKQIITSAIIFTCVTKLFAQTPSNLETIESYWRAKNYNGVITSIDNYYAANTKKRLLKLDLMKVSSYCIKGINNPNPKLCFTYIKNAYKLSTQAKALIDNASDNCTSININDVNQFITSSSIANIQLPMVRGKTGAFTLEGKYKNLGDSLKIIKHISYEDLQKRKLKRNQGVNAAIFYKHLYDSLGFTNYKLKVLDKFIIVYTSLNSSVADFKTVEKKLDAYFSFYIKEYDMASPEEYITLFFSKRYYGA